MFTPLRSFLSNRVHVLHGDITALAVDAIVNAANSQLAGGGGVDGAIHRAGGPAIGEACRELRRTTYPHGLPTGEAVATTGGYLPAKNVIHAVGPIYGQESGREAELLAACYRNSLQLAADSGWSTIAFPAISTGIYGYPREAAAEVSSAAIAQFLRRDPPIAAVQLVFFLADDAQVFLANQQFENG